LPSRYSPNTSYSGGKADRTLSSGRPYRDKTIILGGIEIMHMIAKGQMKNGGTAQTPAQQFYSLVK
jgi:hypothetical protein